jgi:hypothetical protein
MSMTATSPWQLTIGRLTIQWAAAQLGVDRRPATPDAPRHPPLYPVVEPALPVEAIAAQLAEGAQVLLDARPRRSAPRGTPPTQGAAWRTRVDVWMGELGG